LVDAVLSSFLENNRKQCIDGRQNAENAIHEVFKAFDMMEEMFNNMNPSMVFELEKYHPPIYKKIQHHKYVFLYQVLKQNLERGIKEELYRPEINVDILTRVQDREHDACVQFRNFPDKPYSFDKYTGRDTGAFYLRAFHYKRTKADSEI
jgi:hypothetical protein